MLLKLTDGSGEDGSGDGHEQHVCGREGAEARFDRNTEASDDDGEFTPGDESESGPET